MRDKDFLLCKFNIEDSEQWVIDFKYRKKIFFYIDRIWKLKNFSESFMDGALTERRSWFSWEVETKKYDYKRILICLRFFLIFQYFRF